MNTLSTETVCTHGALTVRPCQLVKPVPPHKIEPASRETRKVAISSLFIIILRQMVVSRDIRSGRCDYACHIIACCLRNSER